MLNPTEWVAPRARSCRPFSRAKLTSAITSASLAGVYVQAISAYAPHPAAAKLWMEYLYSDEGQTAWLKGYCHPARFNAMAKSLSVLDEMKDEFISSVSHDLRNPMSATMLNDDEKRQE